MPRLRAPPKEARSRRPERRAGSGEQQLKMYPFRKKETENNETEFTNMVWQVAAV